MQIVKMKEVPEKTANIPLFTGGLVTYQPLITKRMGKDFNMLMVNFSKGARNKFHCHTSDQILIVTAGKGMVATEKEQKIIEAGDIIFIPANEKHWHGATEESEFSHIFVMRGGSRLRQLED